MRYFDYLATMKGIADHTSFNIFCLVSSYQNAGVKLNHRLVAIQNSAVWDWDS